MERVRPPRSSDDSVLETIGPLPSAHSLKVLLEVVRSPGVMKADVDELLQGLARPLAESESPRSRADFLLALIEADDVSDMQGSDGHTVRAAAVQALLGLGYPYALEIPPEALDDARGLAASGPREIPTAGLIATLVGLLVQAAVCLPAAFDLLSSNRTGTNVMGLVVLGAVLGPALSAGFGGLLQKRGLQRLGLITMALTGSLWMIIFATAVSNSSRPLSQTITYTSLIAGLGFLLGAILTRSPGWLAEEGVAPEVEAEEAPEPQP